MVHKEFLFACVLLCCLAASHSQTSSSSPKTSTPASSTRSPTQSSQKSTQSSRKPTSTTPKTTSTLTPEESCATHNGSCDDCVKDAKCMYCYTDDTCKLYPSGKVLPTSECTLSKARWGVCWLNFEAMIIAVSVIGGVIILTVTCLCIYCCCCRGTSKRKYDKEDRKYEQQKMERKMKQDERRTERKGRLDEIRRKYGLVKDDAPYQRFDA